ncbi:laminin-like protein epi-1 [Favolaschia claudopus]|uniref:Laminin-like protein epi-1 n=1 Tax=Favolaschia claudopus TaxID=2862362 RepID=A0AAW0EI84_9AGAR
MADPAVEPIPAAADEPNGEVEPSAAAPPAEHEASGPAADDLSLADLSTNPPADTAPPVDPPAPTEGESLADTQDAEPDAEPGKVEGVKAKAVSTVKAAATKANGAAGGVKKILSAGTFGAGKSNPSKPSSSSSATAKPVAAPLKKSVSGPSATNSKPAMASSTSGSASATARRASVVPAKSSAPPLKASLSASASSKPTTAPSNATARGSVVSPTGTKANGKAAPVGSAAPVRPRASVSVEGVKRAPVSARQSLSSATSKPTAPAASKPSTSAATKAPAAKAPAAAPKARTAASISSIKEVQEDTKALEELQTKLQEATASLASKAEAAIQLEAQVEELKASLATALADVETKGSTTTELTEAKAASESQLKEANDALEKLRSEHQEGASALTAIQEDVGISQDAYFPLSNSFQLAAARTATATQKDLIENLQAQIQTLEAEVSASKASLEVLQASHSGADSDAAAAAVVEHEALLKAQADFTTIEGEIVALKAAQTQALNEVQAQLEAAESKAALVENLETQLKDLRAEKEDAVAKLSEMEIEVLELKESQESAEDERAKTAAKISALEKELSDAVAATQQAIDSALAKEAEHVSQAEGAKASYESELKSISDLHAEVTSQLEALKAEMASAAATHQAAVEEQGRTLAEAENGFSTKQTELSDEIRRITAELEGQEAQYNAKVDAVKAEHDKLLQEAFERAKAEASDLHQQDLQALRAQSSSSVEQVRASHESALNDLKQEHASALESTVGGLEKQIAKLNLELKATQDDLAKAKTNVEAARVEVENLTAQRDEAKAALSAAPEVSPQHAEEVSRLTKELSIVKDDLQDSTEMLNLTKASLEELSNNHTRELEELAQARAEETMKLRAAHDEEITTLASQKSELLTKLSDLEGELATLKATIEAGAPAPKEELQRMHEAHNLKVGDMQADHEKAIKGYKDELEASLTKVDELNAEVARKAMEIQYLESDQDENAERVTRLQEDLQAANDKLKALGANPDAVPE